MDETKTREVSRRDSRDSKFLKYAGTLSYQIKEGEFISSDVFKVNNRRDAAIRIHFIGHNFDFFCRSIIAQKIPAKLVGWKDFHSYRVRADISNDNLFDPLGGELLVRAPLIDLYFALLRQGRGQKGELLVNGDANIFLTVGFDDSTIAVFFVWNGQAWGINSLRFKEAAIGVGNKVFARSVALPRQTKEI